MPKKATQTTAKLSSTKSTKSNNTTTCATKKCTTKKASTCSSNNNLYKNNGLTINPSSFTSGDKIKLTYNGLLSQCGASEVFAHIGWGDTWEDVNDIKMSKTKSGFTATITVDKSAVLNVCFKDASNNWDNNNGYNYSIYPENN